MKVYTYIHIQSGHTALSIAKYQQHAEVAAILRAAGARE
jgi:hypothetical protein